MASSVGRTPDDLKIPPVGPDEEADAAPARVPRRPGEPVSAEERLRDEPFVFEFFQAVRLLHLLEPDAAEVGHAGPFDAEAVRFRAMASTSFPPSAISDFGPTRGHPESSTMTVSFFGLIGPKGVLPQPYTEMVMQQEMKRIESEPEKNALRAWFDLFNHRLTGLFYRAWEKYRFVVPFERTERRPARAGVRDLFTSALLSLIGLGTRGLRDRLGAAPLPDTERLPPAAARIDDLALLYFSGLIAHRNRSAVGLETILTEYFGLPITVHQFQGQWLMLEEAQQSTLGGDPDARSYLGRSVVAGSRVWELGSKIRIRLGPLGYGDFRAFLPDPVLPGRFFALSRLVRFYVGPDLDFDVQLVLRRDCVPSCRLGGGEGTVLGWNGWIATGPLAEDRDDAIFEEMESNS
jgi:type VI secretion system protein ImpH